MELSHLKLDYRLYANKTEAQKKKFQISFPFN